jgi:hypothetical protein
MVHLSGAVAQLGERLLCKQEVIGSIPFGSTSSLGSFLTSRERKKIENGYRRFAPSNLFFGCLTLWIGCKARLDASSRAHGGVELLCGDGVGFGQCTSK